MFEDKGKRIAIWIPAGELEIIGRIENYAKDSELSLNKIYRKVLTYGIAAVEKEHVLKMNAINAVLNQA